ncbi:MAG: helix-turn-helix domain-containing protein [Dysgonomonas sp.]
MKIKIRPFNWQEELKNADGVYSIGNDFILLDNSIDPEIFKEPYKVDITTAIICTKGTARGKINLESYTTEAPCLTVILSGQILQHEFRSEDFEASYIVMSKQFTESLNIREGVPIFLSVQKNAIIPLGEEDMLMILDYFTMLKKSITGNTSNKIEVAKHLILALFYGLKLHSKNETGKLNKARREVIVSEFMGIVQEHYKEERKLTFYADKLHLTSRHLSYVIKESTGISASDWIDRYVILEAKALLKSTNMTIQEISDELNFPSQSFFGKYFKRITSISPREYKKR